MLTSATVSSVSLVWTASTDNVGVAGYHVYVNGTKVGSTTETGYTASGLACATSYRLGVRAFDARGNLSAESSAYSSTSACVVEPPPPSSPPPPPPPPPAPVAAPSNTSLPTISGTPMERQTLAASTGTWSGTPTGYAYQWNRCDGLGGGCNAIAGANGQSYSVATADVGATLRVRVTASNDGGSTSATSAQTAAVAPAPTTGTMLPPPLPQSTGATYYVSTSGADTNPGTLSAPWRTVQKALNTLQPGQIALVRGGSYAQNLVMTRAGTAIAPITIRNYPGEQAMLGPGSGATNNMPLQLGTGAAYVRLQGLVLEGASGPSTTNVYAWGNAHDIELSQCEVRNSQRQGFFSEATTSRVHIIGCYIHDNGGSGPIQLDHNVYMEGHSHLIADCLIKNAPNGFGVQIYPSSDHVILTENTIVGALRDGIIVGSDGATTTEYLTITNNVVAFNGRYGISTYWGGAVGTGNVANNNVVWGNSAGQLSGNGITYSGGMLTDPLFVDRAAGNFHLQSTSPARDRGLASYARVTDLAGAPRPQGSGPDPGAYEN